MSKKTPFVKLISDLSHPVYSKQWRDLPFPLCPISPAYTAVHRLLLAKGKERHNVMRNLKECSSERNRAPVSKKLRQNILTFRYESSIVGSYFSTKMPCTNWTVWIRKQENHFDEKTMRSNRESSKYCCVPLFPTVRNQYTKSFFV